jgi:hypothetical protein
MKCGYALLAILWQAVAYGKQRQKKSRKKEAQTEEAHD